MEVNDLLDVLEGRYAPIFDELCCWQAIKALGIKPFKDGNQWCFLYGENLQEGVSGFGDTIQEAAMDFYAELSKCK